MNNEKLARFILVIIQLNYDKILSAHELEEWDKLEDEIIETLRNMD